MISPLDVNSSKPGLRSKSGRTEPRRSSDGRSGLHALRSLPQVFLSLITTNLDTDLINCLSHLVQHRVSGSQVKLKLIVHADSTQSLHVLPRERPASTEISPKCCSSQRQRSLEIPCRLSSAGPSLHSSVLCGKMWISLNSYGLEFYAGCCDPKREAGLSYARVLFR